MILVLVLGVLNIVSIIVAPILLVKEFRLRKKGKRYFHEFYWMIICGIWALNDISLAVYRKVRGESPWFFAIFGLIFLFLTYLHHKGWRREKKLKAELDKEDEPV